MVQIFLENFHNKEVCSVYTLSSNETVWDLKTAVEDEEGLPAGSQRLEFNGQALENSQLLEKCSIPENGLITLVQTPVSLVINVTRLEQSKPVPNLPKTVIMPIDLNMSSDVFEDWLVVNMHKLIGEAFQTPCKMRMRWMFKDRELLGSGSKTVFEQGIREGDVVHVTYEEMPESDLDTVEVIEFHYDRVETRRYSPTTTCQQVQVNHDWDGHMKHPRVKGRPLHKGECFLAADYFDSREQEGWIQDLDLETAYLPSNFISSTDLSSSESPSLQGKVESISTEARPKLPPFDYPKASPMEFRVNVADRGHSLVNISLEYDNFSSPDDSTRVRVKIYCQGFGTRRISAIGLHITTPENKVVDFQPKYWKDSEVVETEYDSNDRETSQYGLQSFGVNFAGVGVDADMGVTREKEQGMNYHGKQYSSKEINGSILQGDTVSWTFKEAVNGPGGSGLDGESAEMWFELSGKPDRFEYDCLVTHVKDRKEKVKQAMSRSWFQRYF
ncbi:hypothetical protein VKT23_015160 [Stygiomarasmius scandens]|uniref:Ubiquitin-like domain-containing protein n=1 Tax=Marasmiellus scandens TaxID=2682957 RepID=A0ABR1J3C6_9AGAR